ncbi:hypothetical protein FRB97_000942 [Tulasnella sp. 331]|nr:hypothetical protein FRB97_000942 [Tulasnella sp. 331]
MFLDDINSAGLVCRAWRVLALEVKWRRADFRSLISVAAPTQAGDCPEWILRRQPQIDDWRRFDDIAYLVQSILIRGTKAVSKALGDSIHTRTSDCTSPLLSDLRMASIELTYGDKIDEIDIIMSIFPSNLRDLSFSNLRYLHTSDLITLTDPIPTQFPQLSALALHGSAWLGSALEQSVSRLSNLRIIDLPDMQLCAQVVQPLAKLQNLEIVRTGGNPHVLGEISTGLVGTGAFPRLLELRGHFLFDHTTGSFLEELSSTHSLKILEITYSCNLYIMRPGDLEVVTRVIALYVLLQQLTLYVVFSHTMNASVLKTLSSCSALEALEIDMNAESIQVTDDDVERFLKHLLHLERLILCLKAGTTPLHTLHSLAAAFRHCPRLNYVSLWADATSAKLPTMPLPFHKVPVSLNFVMRHHWNIACPIDSAQAVAQV